MFKIKNNKLKIETCVLYRKEDDKMNKIKEYIVKNLKWIKNGVYVIIGYRS